MAEYRVRRISTRAGDQLLVCDHCYGVIAKRPEEGGLSPEVRYDYGRGCQGVGCEVHEPSYPLAGKWVVGEVSFAGTWNRALCEHEGRPHPPHATHFLRDGDPVFCPGTPGPGVHIHYHWAVKGDIYVRSEFWASWGSTCEEAGMRETDYPRDLNGPLPAGTGHACGNNFEGDYRPI